MDEPIKVAKPAIFLLWGLLVAGGCGTGEPPGGILPPPGDVELAYVGSSACMSCHPGIGATHALHGHSQALKVVQGGPPSYPDIAEQAGVPSPPDGFEWFDIDFVIDGYAKFARFISADGYVLTDGTTGVKTQYNLPIGIAQTDGAFVSYLPEQTDPLPFLYEVFRRRTTGATSILDNGGQHEGNRPGIEGTWAEPGVQCEACHGPGSQHLPAPEMGNILVSSSASICGICHTNPSMPDTILAEGGFILGQQQYAELQASPHRGFACTLCHDPHVSTIYQPEEALRNDCQTCHPDANMAYHDGVVFTWGDYTETVTCVSCHMPPAVKNAVGIEIELSQGLVARIGDTRSHLFRINTRANDSQDMFNEDGTAVAVDDSGQGAVTACYSCQRCHHGQGNAFALTPSESCAVGTGIHDE
jgi:hypothetical protein